MKQLLFLLLFLPSLLYSQSEGGFGFRRFANKTALDAVSVSNIDKSASRRAYVHSTGLYYRWNGSAWINEIGIDTLTYTNDTLRLSLFNDGVPAKLVRIVSSSGGDGLVDTVRTMDSLRIYNGTAVLVFLKEQPQTGWFLRLDNAVVDDGGIYINGTNNWVRYVEDLNRVNVKWFGAVGDSLTNDNTAIQAALAYSIADSIPGSILYFPAGRYSYTSVIYAYKPVNFSIQGDAMSNTYLFPRGCVGISIRTDSVTYQTDPFYGAAEARDFEIKNISVIATGTQPTRPIGVKMLGGFNVKFENLRVEEFFNASGFGTGIRLDNPIPGNTDATQHTTFDNVWVAECDTGIVTRLHNTMMWHDVKVDQSNKIGVVLRNGVYWNKGMVQGSQNCGIWIDNSNPFVIKGIHLTDLHIEANAYTAPKYGTIYKPDGVDMSQLVIENCYLSSPGASKLFNLRRVQGAKITFNTYTGNATDTISLTSIYNSEIGRDNYTTLKLVTSDCSVTWLNGDAASVATLAGLSIGTSIPGRNYLNVGGDAGVTGTLGVGTQIPLAQLHVTTGDIQDTSIVRLQNTTGFTQLFRNTATPEGDIAGNPGDFAYTSISSTGRWWGKATGTGNTGWVEFYTTGNLPSSVNIYTADGTTDSTERTVTLLDDINFIGASGTADFYVETGTTGGRLDVSVDSSRLYFTDGSGTNAVSSSATAVMLKTGTTDQVTILTDKINLVDASGTTLDVEVKDDTRFKVDSLEDFAIGRWPNFPDAFEYLAKNRYGLLISDNTSSGKKTTIAGMAYNRTSSSYISSDRGSYQLNASNYLASGTAEMVTGAVPNSFYNYNTHPLEPYDNIEMGFRNQWVGIPKDKTQYAYLYQGGDRTISAPYDTAAITMWIGIPQITDTTSTAKSTLGTKAVSKVRGWGVQSLFHRTSTQQVEHPYNWIKISTGSVAADTLLNGIQFYNNKYQFINSTPSPTVGDTSIMGWVGTGSVTTPIWLLKSQFGGGSGTNIYNSNGTTTANTRTATILESIRFVGTADFGQQYPFQVHSTGNEPPIQLWKGNTDSVYLYQSDVEYHFGSSTVLAVQSSEYLILAGDSIQVATLESKTKLHNIVGITNNNILKRIQGTSGGQVLTWNASGYWELGAGGGGAVADGDYGDITVSSSGTVWTIDTGVVTNTKLASGAGGIYKGSGTIASGTVSTLTASSTWRVNYSGATAGLLLDDTNNAATISGASGTYAVSADNTSAYMTGALSSTFTLGSTGGTTLTASVANTNTVNTRETIITNSSGTAATGLGTGTLYQLETSTTNSQDAAEMDVVWSDATHASRTGDFVFKTVASANALAEAFRIGGSTYALTATADVSNTNTAADRFIIRTNSFNTPAVGLGGRILFQGESSTTTNLDMGGVGAVWQTVTHATRTSNVVTYGVNNAGTITEFARMGPGVAGGAISLTIGGGTSTYANNGIAIGTAFSLGGNSALTLGGAGGVVNITTSSTSTGSILFQNSSTTTGGIQFGNTALTNTALSKKFTKYADTYTVASGTGSYTAISIENTFNLTSTASGTQIGLDINPTLTSLASGVFYGVNIPYSNASAKGIYQTGNATTNNFVGATGFGATTAPTDKVEITGNLALLTAGNKIKIATGSNASIGTSAAMTAGTITISTTAVTANSIIFLTIDSFGGTPGVLEVGTITAGTSFVINSSSALDTSTVNWIIFN